MLFRHDILELILFMSPLFLSDYLVSMDPGQDPNVWGGSGYNPHPNSGGPYGQPGGPGGPQGPLTGAAGISSSDTGDSGNSLLNTLKKEVLQKGANINKYIQKNNIGIVPAENNAAYFFEHTPEQEGPLTIRQYDLQVAIEKYVNAIVKAKLTGDPQANNHADFLVFYCNHGAPGYTETELRSIFNESLSCQGERPIFDPRNRPANWDPRSGSTTPTAESSTSAQVEALNKRRASPILSAVSEIEKKHKTGR